MRKTQQKFPLSPRPKLQLKSPTGRPKLKVSSPIHSQRSSLSKPYGNKKSQQKARSQQKRIIWLPSSTLYSFVHPLQRFESVGFTFQLTISSSSENKSTGKQKNKIWIISSIDSFIDAYMQLNDEMKIECQKWYIISNAINSKQAQQQFNQLYGPINFIFLPSISSVLNQLLCYTNNTIYRSIDRIYDLSLASSSQNLSVQQTLIENIHSPKQNCLYIINDAKQWMHFCTKVPVMLFPYFFTGVEEFRDAKISIKIPPVSITKKEIFYVLFQFQKPIRTFQGFLQYEANYKKDLLSNGLSIASKVGNKNQIYLNKIIQKLLIPQKKTLIFMQPLSRSSLLQPSQLRERFPKNYILFQSLSSLYRQSDVCYKLKWNTKTKSCQQLSINTTMTIIDQIKKIQTFINDKESLGALYTASIDKLKKMQIYAYNRGNDDEKARYYRHCITSALQRNEIKINYIQNLQYLVQTHKITLIYGNFTFSQIKSVNKFYNIFLIPLSNESQQVAPCNQIAEARSFIEVALNSYNQIYGQLQSQLLQVFVHVLYEQQTQLPGILRPLTIPQPILKTHYLPSFHVQVEQFRECSKHIVISKMEIFDEGVQQMIRQYQWKNNTVSIQIYLEYGQQYIFRNKQGSYKFIKVQELQQKINQIYDSYGRNKVLKETNLNNKKNNNEKAKNQPVLQNLNQLNKLQENNEDLDNLVEQVSIVELYVDNRSNFQQNREQKNREKYIEEVRKKQMEERISRQHHYQYYNNTNSNKSPNSAKKQVLNRYQDNKNNQSLIQILNQSQLRGSLVDDQSSDQRQNNNILNHLSNSTINIVTTENIEEGSGSKEIPSKINSMRSCIGLDSQKPFNKNFGENDINQSQSKNNINDIVKNTNNKEKKRLVNQDYQFSAQVGGIQQKSKIKKNDKIQKTPHKNGQRQKVASISQNKNKKPRQKSTYIKQYKEYNHQPIKIQVQNTAIIGLQAQAGKSKSLNSNQLLTLEQSQKQQPLSLNLLSSQNPQPQLYKLYIFIHRSVPHYSLKARSQKQYHILLYTRLQEVLVFARYLKPPEEKIVVIANEQSAKIYGQLIGKAGVLAQRVSIVFSKDLSQNFIRNQVDKILKQENLVQNRQKDRTIHKKFKALVIYSPSNERVLKALKIIRKIFGHQLKLQFLKQKQYQQMLSSKFGFSLSPDTNVYKVGIANTHNTKNKSRLSPQNPQFLITSIRSLFILAMHTQLKGFRFDGTNLEFSLESWIGRMLYNNSDKDYVLTGSQNIAEKLKPTPVDNLKKKIFSMKSQKNLLKHKQSYISSMRSQVSQRRKSQSLRRSNISRSSTTALYRSSTTTSVIISSALKEQLPTRNIFISQPNLYSLLLQSHSYSKLAIVVLTQKQFDIFDIFQATDFQYLTKEIVWVVETRVQGKQIFCGKNVVFTLIENIKDTVDKIIKEYQVFTHFDTLIIDSKIDSIKSGHYGGTLTSVKQHRYNTKIENNKVLNIQILNKFQQVDLSPSFHSQKSNKTTLTIVLPTLKDQKQAKKLKKNTIQFPSIDSIKQFNQLMTQKFQPHGQNHQQIPLNLNLGSVVYLPQAQYKKLIKSSQLLIKKNLMYIIYDTSRLVGMLGYTIFRVLIVKEGESEKQRQNGKEKQMSTQRDLEQQEQDFNQVLAKCQNVIDIDKNIDKDKLGKLIAMNLL